jgi:hypothetical protein
MKDYDSDFLTRPKKFLLNNSTDKSTYDRYDELCKEYDFEHIVHEEGNLGICVGRQFIAEHFDKSGLDYMKMMMLNLRNLLNVSSISEMNIS